MFVIVRYILIVSLLTGFYYLAGQVGLYLHVVYADLTPLWPPSGFAVALLWAYGKRWWPVIPCGEIAIAWMLGQPLTVGMGGGAAQLVEALMAYFALQALHVRKPLDSTRDVLNFTLFGAVLPAAVGASVGLAGWQLNAFVSSGAHFSSWFTWWLGDAMGILIMTPFVVCWTHWPLLSLRIFTHWLVMFVLLLACSVGLFWIAPEQSHSLFFLLQSFMVLAALRVGLVGVTSTAVLLAGLVLGMNRELAQDDFIAAVRITFVGVSALTGYLIAAILAEGLRSRDQLAMEKERAWITLQSIVEGVISTNIQGQVQFLNTAAEEMTGWSYAQAKGLPIEMIWPVEISPAVAQGLHPIRRLLKENTRQGPPRTGQLRNHRGRSLAIEFTIVALCKPTDEESGAVITFRDVTEESRIRDELAYQAEHDRLTGLVNRASFENRLYALTKRNGITPLKALLYLDLDQFKLINDTCGHEVGDHLLANLSRQLRNVVPEPHCLARLGGDEFGILVVNCPEDEVLALAEVIRQTVVDYRYRMQDLSFQVGVSIGVAFFVVGEDTPSALLSRADVACHMAKEQGRNRIHCYRNEDLDMLRRHGEIHWISQLRSALEEDRFQLYYQRIFPIADEQDQNPPSLEILLRLKENNTLVSPATFLPVAERYGFMPVIDRWVLEQTFRLLGSGNSEGRVCCVNLTGPTLDDEEFLDYILGLQARYGVNPHDLCMEVTETLAINHLTRAVKTMKALSALGYRFALDDFGSGVASFGYLEELPVHFVKIDGRFVKRLKEDKTHVLIIESLAKLARMRGLGCIAEWVETEDVIDELKRLGVGMAQGYYLHRPEPLETTST